LLDVQSVAFTDRMRRIVAEDRPLFQLIDPSQRLEQLGYQSWTVERLLNEFDRTRAGDVAFLRSLSPDDLQRIGQHQEAGDVSVSDLAHYCAVHDMMHLAQIAKMLQAHLSDRVGNMRRYMAEG
jgi:predicted ATP-dependent protease